MAELTEGRPVTEGNSQQFDRIRTQSRTNTTSRLLAVREAAKRDKSKQFSCLFHHINEALLMQSFLQLKRQSALGCDGVTWEGYAQNVHDNFRELHARLHRGQYKPRPSRQVFIPKEDGSERPLSILCLEDKIVQQAVVTVLNQIYETDFLGFTHYIGELHNGKAAVMRKTRRSRRIAQLKAIKQALRKRLHEKPTETGRWLRRVVEGHLNYYGVPFNIRALTQFVEEVKRLWLKSLRRRSQRHRMNWARFSRMCERWIPSPRIIHPYPMQRFHARTRSRSRMR